MSGAALDVYEEEPANNNPLFNLPNVVALPTWVTTIEAQENVALQVAEQMSNYLLEGAVENASTCPLSVQKKQSYGAWVKLSQYLGSFVAR